MERHIAYIYSVLIQWTTDSYVIVRVAATTIDFFGVDGD